MVESAFDLCVLTSSMIFSCVCLGAGRQRDRETGREREREREREKREIEKGGGVGWEDGGEREIILTVNTHPSSNAEPLFVCVCVCVCVIPQIQ